MLKHMTIEFYQWNECDEADYLHRKETASLTSSRSSYMARKALIKCLNINSLPHKWEDLEQNHFHNLKNAPEQLSSLSHTKNWGAAVIASAKHYDSLGIDIELKERKFPQQAEHYFLNSQDELEGLTNLEKWSLKEASFKAAHSYMKARNKKKPVKILKNIWIKKNHPHLALNPNTDESLFSFGLLDDQSIQGIVTQLPHQKLILSVAFLENKTAALP